MRLSPLFVAAAGLAVVAPSVRAEPEPAAKAALEAMAAAVSKTQTLSYQIELKGVGLFEMLPTIKCEVIAARVEKTPNWQMRVTGRSETTGAEPTEILFVSDGTKKTWIDYPNKTVLERAQQDLGPVGQAVSSAAIREVFEASPFSRELKSPNIKMEPQVEVDGVACEVVYVDPGENLTKSRYAIATTDRLPRRVELIIEGSGINGRSISTLTKVKIDQPVPEGSFAISKPEGFAFSPMFAPPPPDPKAVAGDGAAPPPPKKVRAVGANLGDLAPDFDLATPGGDKIKLYGQRGYVIVLDFWGSWHAPCRKTTAEVQKIADAYKGKPVKVFGLSVREGSEAAPAKFFKDNNLSYTLLLKGDDAAKAYRVRKYPMLFVIGKEGEIVYSVAGYDDKNVQEIKDHIDQALASSTKPGKEVDPTGAAGDSRTKAQPGGDDADSIK